VYEKRKRVGSASVIWYIVLFRQNHTDRPYAFVRNHASAGCEISKQSSCKKSTIFSIVFLLLVYQHTVTLRQGLKPHGFFCLSSVRDRLSNGAWLRLGAHRNGGGKAESAPPYRRMLSWAVPSPLVLSCLSERKAWSTTPVFGVLERINTHIFRCCSPGNVPQRRRLFLGAIVRAATLPKAVDWLPVPSQQQIALHSGSTRSCFYPRPTP